MSFPHLYKLQLNVGQYIPDEHLDIYLSRLETRIDSLLAEERKGLSTIVVNRPVESFPVEDGTLNLRLARTIIITLPFGTTNLEYNNIKQDTKDLEDNFITVSRIEGVLDQSQIVMPSTVSPIPVDLTEYSNWPGRYNGIWYQWPTAPTMANLLVAQTFTANKTGILTKINLFFSVINLAGNILITIQTTNEDGKPTGVILETITVDPEYLKSLDGNTEATFYCNGNTHLISGTKYALVFDASDIHGDENSWGFFYACVMYYALPSTTDRYTRGELLIYNNDSWETTKNSDYVIQTFDLGPGHGWNGLIPPINQDAWNNTENMDLYFKTFILED
jgi:hypothetical protein